MNLNSKINLKEYYDSDNLKHLFKVFPKLKPKNYIDSKTSSTYRGIYLTKYNFYNIVLKKVKIYFELNGNFTVSNTLNILLQDIKNIFEYESNDNKNNDIINPNLSPGQYLNKNYSLLEESKKRTASKKSNGDKSFDVYIKPRNIRTFHVQNNEANSTIPNILKKKKILNIKNSFDFKISTDSCTPIKFGFSKKMKAEPILRNKLNGINYQASMDNSIFKKNGKRKSFIMSQSLFDKLSYDIDLKKMYDIDNKNFDIFKFSETIGKDNVLPLVGNYIFNFYELKEIMDITKFRNWCEKISGGYINSNYYHNSIHAADITHTSHIYFKYGLINNKIKLNKSSICSLFLSCICHDFKHPGFNNNFLIETKSALAIQYNDASVLENMHIAETFKIINQNNDFNILEKLNNDEYKIFRKQMISCVLSTDMTKHSKSVDFLEKCLSNDNKEVVENDSQNYMNLIIHSADISNPTKKFEIYFKWADLVVKEFYYQGDREKKLGLKCSCDRNKVTLYKSQLGFIDYVVNPFFSLFVKLFPKLHFFIDNLEENRKKIKALENEDIKSKKTD